MIDFTPNPIAFSLGSIDVRWYGIAYVVAIVAGTWLATHEARRRGERTDMIVDALIVIAVAALIGGRAYHVIDQWSTGPDYKDHLLQIFLPPYSGLGIYGGLFTGLLATIWLTRHYKVNFWRWADIMAPAILLAQVLGRWGNFANQELYGPPTTLPWGIAIQCQYRVAQYACPAGSDPTATLGQHFIPLFLYESLLSLLGMFVLLWLWNHFTARGRILIAGDVGLMYFAWYGLERTFLEQLRSGWDWVLFGVPTAQIVGVGAAVAAVVAILIRHWYVRRHPAAPASDEASPRGPWTRPDPPPEATEPIPGV
jgi:phosphatidylglycerol---prolipoprotein diacylglyceryl transferase